MPLVLLPPLQPQYPEPPVGKPKPPRQIPIKLRNAWTVEALTRARDKSKSHVARILAAGPHAHPIITSKDHLRRPQQRALLVWILGRVAYHQACEKCDQDNQVAELSRAHAVMCANVTEAIETAFGGPLHGNNLQTTNHATVLDIAISKLQFKLGDAARTNAIVSAIEKIRTLCAGQRRFEDASSASAQEEAQAVLQYARQLAPGGDRDENDEDPLVPDIVDKAARYHNHQLRKQQRQMERRRQDQGGRPRTIPRAPFPE